MNYPNLPGRKRPPRKSNFVLLLILGFMAFFLFTQYKKSQVRSDANRGDVVIPDISNDGPQGNAGNGRLDSNPLEAGSSAQATVGIDPSNGDWSLDTDVPVEDPQTQSVVGSDKGISETNSGDWSLEVGDSRASNGGTAVKTKPESKTTTKGDWEITEVDK